MRTLSAALLLTCAAVLLACGGGSTESPLVGAGTTATGMSTTGSTTPAGDGRSASSRGSAADERRSCEARGITVPPFNEGACVQGGTRFVVANGRSLMRLRTLDVALRGFTVVEELRRGGERLAPQGVFVVVRLAVKNRTGEPQRFQAGQTLLVLEQQRFQEHEIAEERFKPEALAYARRAPLRPGEKVEGVVVYDVAISDVDRLTREGQLLVANFGGGAVREVGQFRIGAS